MIYFNLYIQNPFCKKQGDLLFYKIGKFSENKRWELFFWKNCESLFGFRFEFTPIKRSHGGLFFGFNLLGFDFDFEIFDHRHWDAGKNNWEDINGE